MRPHRDATGGTHVGALDGIRVIDVGLLVQGPQAGQTLRDLGAEVIKVELPGMGDQARWIPLSPDDLRTPYYEACNRGKRSITADLRTPGGAEVFHKLVDTADVLLGNFKPGTLEGWGLGYDELSATNPGLIYAMGSTFGTEGPGAEREGADLAAQAAGGLISTIGKYLVRSNLKEEILELIHLALYSRYKGSIILDAGFWDPNGE